MQCPICGAAHTACPGTLPTPQFVLDLEAKPMASNLWTADRRLYLDKDRKVVEADDPTRQSLLVAQGGTIPLADAERYGLITVTPAVITPVAPAGDEKASDDTQKMKPAPANKAAAPKANK